MNKDTLAGPRRLRAVCLDATHQNTQDTENEHDQGRNRLFQRIADSNMHGDRPHHQDADHHHGGENQRRQPDPDDQRQRGNDLEKPDQIYGPAGKTIDEKLPFERHRVAAAVRGGST